MVQQPKFTHQVFEGERIYGYKNLRIDVCKMSNTLKTLLRVRYTEKKTDATDVVGLLSKIMAPGYTEDAELFKRVGTPWSLNVLL